MYERFKHRFDIPYTYTKDCKKNIRKWCKEQFGRDGYDLNWDWDICLDEGGHYTFYCVTEKDLNWLILRWSQ